MVLVEAAKPKHGAWSVGIPTGDRGRLRDLGYEELGDRETGVLRLRHELDETTHAELDDMGVLVVGDQQRRKSVEERQSPTSAIEPRQRCATSATSASVMLPRAMIAPAVLRGRPGTRVQHAIGSASFWRYSLEPR
jgi:hypothetical protein